MSFSRTILFLTALCAVSVVPAQEPPLLRGVVLGRSEGGRPSPVPDAQVRRSDGTYAVSDTSGRFALPAPVRWPDTLTVTAFGWSMDPFVLQAMPAADVTLLLEPSVELEEAQIVERQSGTRLSTRTLQAIESIGAKELKRAACCDLSESFETNATVDVNYSDAVSGAKTIRMLGLDGKYAQISVENIPFVRGLSSSSGLTLIPGPWIQEINVSKGIGTAVNGPNAMTGQIDLCLLDPATAPALFTNLYVNSQGRTELNVNAAQHLGAAGDNLLMVQGSLLQRDMDDNGDGFRDQPLTRRVNVMDRWLQRTGKRTSQVVLRYVSEGRDGGQTDAHRLSEGPNGRHYTVEVDNEMADVIAKNGWILNDSTKSIGVLTAFRYHVSSSLFGDRTYDGTQRSGYANVVYQQLLAHGNDQLKMGASLQFDDYAEAYNDSTFGRTERMPGVFAEYTRSRQRFTVVAGLRADLNSYYGGAVSPRLHLKYDLGVLTTVRLSAGYAFRSANPLVENAGALASSRRVVVEGPLGLERSWNTGFSFLHKFKWGGRKWAVGVDAYRSDLTSQVVADLDRSPQVLALYMLDGPSYANSVLTDVQVALTRVLDLKVSYRWYDVRTTYDGVLRERPFIPTHRAMADLAYNSRNEKWRFDIVLNGFGTARLPDTSPNPEPYRLPGRSPAYATLNAQFTHVVQAWEFYLGAENLTSTIQSRQIIAPEDPFGPYFDASLIWGPTNMRMIYGGLRFTLTRKNEQKTP